MDISDVYTDQYETVDADAPVRSFRSRFTDGGLDALVVLADGEYLGVVTPREVTRRQVDPEAKASTLVWHVPRVGSHDDVREVARLLVSGGSRALPVFDGDDLVGVVTAEGVLSAVRSFLGVLSVDDVATHGAVTVAPDDTLGRAINRLREEGVSHLPVVEDGDPVGMVGLRDLVEFTSRAPARSQGGESDTATGRGGFGERAGDVERLLDLPVDTVMAAPVETTSADEPLDEAVGRMLDAGISSLVLLEDGDVAGIVTTTDALRSLTWDGEPGLVVQITNVDLMDDIGREEVAETIEGIAAKYARMSVLEAKVDFHEHTETLRGMPYVQARVRLFTDRGHFVATGEGYGAAHAFRLAANRIERKILEGKEYGTSMKPASEEELSKLLGWWLVGSPRER